MRSGLSVPVDAGGRRLAAAHVVLLTFLVVVVLMTVALVAGCGSSYPLPEDTLAKFGAAVGPARQDQVDFEKLRADWATPEYGTDQQAQQARFALYMAGKAADQTLNQPKADWISHKTSVKGDTATVTYTIAPKDGSIFAAVSIATITVKMKKTDDTAQPWRVQSVTLGA
jgi:predicted small lipoprotein YifL